MKHDMTRQDGGGVINTSTAVMKPNDRSMRSRSLSIVLGMPDTETFKPCNGITPTIKIKCASGHLP